MLLQMMSFSERAESAVHPLTKRLLKLMDRKHSNLALSADVTTSDELVKVSPCHKVVIGLIRIMYTCDILACSLWTLLVHMYAW